jgi:two-component system, cell cycle response regulator
VKVLIAEDNSGFRQVLERMLQKWGYEVVSASNGLQAWEILQAPEAPRLAILDWMMPELDGVEVCRRVRDQNHEPYIYILLLTAKDTAEELVEGMEAGADDYLKKPVNTHELRVRLRAGQRIIDLQEELVRAREALRRQATRDQLTELWNRTAMFDILTAELTRAKRDSNTVSILMIDLDHFKRVNDTLGHAAGDGVLREAARRMVACVRSYDAVCRYGGEEFLIILPGCDIAAAMLRAEGIRLAVAKDAFQIPEGPLDITCSVGVAASSGADILDVTELIRKADEALYAAKHNNRNRVEAFTPQPVLVN